MKKLTSIILVFALMLSMTSIVSAEDGYTVTPSGDMIVKVNGVEIEEDTVVSDADVIELVVLSENAVVAQVDGVYYPINEEFCVSADADFESAILLGAGLEMVNGAQVRVGQVKLEEGGKLDAMADSGLRFIATADYTDTVITDENVEFGIKVMAEGNSTPTYVKAEKFQNDDKSVFTAAITKINESNYNRKYTACAYAIIPMHDGTEKEINVGSVTRSIYQVSVGILKNSSADYDENLPYTIDDAVREILGAYVNQTGIRLTYFENGTMTARDTGKGAYTGELFFNVTSSVNENGSTHVTITPLGENEGFFNTVTIASWWKDYIRVNNNHTEAVEYISDEKIQDNTLSFTFTVPKKIDYTFNQEDSVTVVSEVGETYIKGFKAGSEVTYNLADSVTVLGLSNSMDDVVPGCVILEGYDSEGKVSAVELLASLGLPINPEGFEADFGVYDASDKSTKYKNIVTEMYSKSGSKITCQNLPDTTKTTYKFASTSAMCYRVGIAMDGDTPVITATGAKISTYPSIFESTAKYHNYLYLRYDSETEKVKECVFYCVPKDLDFSGDGEYSDIFSLDDYRVIIK